MSNLTLSLLATSLCFACGALAGFASLVMDLSGVPMMVVSSVGIGCMPLGVFMGYSAYQESKVSNGRF